MNDTLIEAIEATLESLETLAAEVRRADFDGKRHFEAYHLASLEGRNGGWLAGPFLVDALRDLRGELTGEEPEAPGDDPAAFGRNIR